MFSADTPMQYAFAEHMTDPQSWLALAPFYQQKRFTPPALADSPFRLLPSAGSFFMLAGLQPFQRRKRQRVVAD
jgi:hypothetical protein